MSEAAYRIAMICLIGAAFTFGYATGWVTFHDGETREAIAQPLEAVRELHCQEDEELIIALGANGLPYAFCQQVIER